MGGDEDSKLSRNTRLQLAISACDTSASIRRVKHPIFSETILSDSSFRAHDNVHVPCIPQGDAEISGLREQAIWSVVIVIGPHGTLR